VGDLRIWRQRRRGNFERNELEVLPMVEPALAAALARLRSSSTGRGRARRRCTATPRPPGPARGRGGLAGGLRLPGHPTVRFHLANAFRKLQTRNRAQLVARLQSMLDAHRHEGGAVKRAEQAD
jgi:hypothetical protein